MNDPDARLKAAQLSENWTNSTAIRMSSRRFAGGLGLKAGCVVSGEPGVAFKVDSFVHSNELDEFARNPTILNVRRSMPEELC